MLQSKSVSGSLDYNGETQTFSQSRDRQVETQTQSEDREFRDTQSYSESRSYDEDYSRSYSSSQSGADDDDYDARENQDENVKSDNKRAPDGKATNNLTINTSAPSDSPSLLSSPFGGQMFGFMKDAFSKLVEGRDAIGKMAEDAGLILTPKKSSVEKKVTDVEKNSSKYDESREPDEVSLGSNISYLESSSRSYSEDGLSMDETTMTASSRMDKTKVMPDANQDNIQTTSTDDSKVTLRHAVSATSSEMAYPAFDRYHCSSSDARVGLDSRMSTDNIEITEDDYVFQGSTKGSDHNVSSDQEAHLKHKPYENNDKYQIQKNFESGSMDDKVNAEEVSGDQNHDDVDPVNENMDDRYHVQHGVSMDVDKNDVNDNQLTNKDSNPSLLLIPDDEEEDGEDSGKFTLSQESALVFSVSSSDSDSSRRYKAVSEVIPVNHGLNLERPFEVRIESEDGMGDSNLKEDGKPVRQEENNSSTQPNENQENAPDLVDAEICGLQNESNKDNDTLLESILQEDDDYDASNISFDIQVPCAEQSEPNHTMGVKDNVVETVEASNNEDVALQNDHQIIEGETAGLQNGESTVVSIQSDGTRTSPGVSRNKSDDVKDDEIAVEEGRVLQQERNEDQSILLHADNADGGCTLPTTNIEHNDCVPLEGGDCSDLNSNASHSIDEKKTEYEQILEVDDSRMTNEGQGHSLGLDIEDMSKETRVVEHKDIQQDSTFRVDVNESTDEVLPILDSGHDEIKGVVVMSSNCAPITVEDKVKRMFSTTISSERKKKIGEGRVFICDETERHNALFPLSRNISPWWISGDKISEFKRNIVTPNLSKKKARWYKKQVEESESLLQRRIVQNRPNLKKSSTVEHDITTKVFWWPVPENDGTPSRSNLHKNRTWYFEALKHEIEASSSIVETSSNEAMQKRKVTSITHRSWLISSDGHDKILEAMDGRNPVDVTSAAETNKENSKADQTNELLETPPNCFDAPLQKVDTAVTNLKNIIAANIYSMDKRPHSNVNVSFKNPVLTILKRQTVDSDQILKKHTKHVDDFEPSYIQPKPQILDLVEGIRSDSASRRSNASGTIKLMASQKKNVGMLASADGLLDALLFAAKLECEGEEAEVNAVTKNRVLTTLALLCQGQESRRLICQHTNLVDTLFEILMSDDSEGRLHSCSCFAALAKTEDNRDILGGKAGLISGMANILLEMKDDSIAEKNGNNTEVEPISTTRRIALSTRLNACAAILHLSKQCNISVKICADQQVLNALAICSKDLEDPVHSRCIETICYLTRFPPNNSILAESLNTVEALYKCGISAHQNDRIWTLRAMQNITAHSTNCGSLVTDNFLKFVCSSAETVDSDEEHHAAISVLGNLCTDPRFVVQVTNTEKVIQVLITAAHSMKYSQDSQLIACDALATIAMWLKKIAEAGSIPKGFSFEPLPTFNITGYMRYNMNE